MSGSAMVCVGNIVSDILVRPVAELEFDTTRWVESITQQIGGNGANTSYTLATLGVPVRLHSLLGEDTIGSMLRSKLENAGVDVAGVRQIPGATASTVALVRPDGARMFLHHPGVSRVHAEFWPDFEAAGATKSHFHLANCFSMLPLRVESATLLRNARRAGFTTSLDAGWDSLGEWMKAIGPCLPNIDFLFANIDEARRLAEAETEELAAARLLAEGVGAVLMKRGALGCRIYRAEETLTCPGFAVEAIDTTGAGDCFAGGFLAARWRNATLYEAARFANAVGALNVQQMGAVTGVLPYDQTLAWINSRSA